MKKSTKSAAKKTNGKTSKVQNTGVSEARVDADRQVFNALANLFSTRSRLWETLFDDRRDIDHECGYPKTNELTKAHYRAMYDRLGIARRVNNLYPDECFIINPIIFEDEDPEIKTTFEEEFDDLAKQLRGDSWLESEEGHPFWEYCHRADQMSGLGHFGGVLIGIDDGKELDQPVELKEGNKERDLLYLRVFDESLIQIVNRIGDPNSPRFGYPEFYELSFESVDTIGTALSTTGTGSVNTITKRVHWTRFVHLADNIESSEVFATPRLQVHWNRLYDLTKLLGGSGEMYWKGALPPIFFVTHPELGTDVELDSTSKDVIEQMLNTLQRYGFVPGVTPLQLAPTVVDPSKQIEVQIDAICITEQCPKRIFMGSERGELASSQDSRTWNNRVRARQYRYLVPRLIGPLVDRLILMRVLSTPKSYRVEFKNLNELTEKEVAEVAQRRTECIVKYVQGDGRQIITEKDFWTYIIGLDDSEADGIVDRAEEEMIEIEKEEAVEQEEMMKQQMELAKAQGIPPKPNQPGMPGVPPKPKPQSVGVS